ncbi:MAG: CHAT domain-containing protein, partial [Pyrinomonadaceae bacterium]|nr:CHAT domain-containing protein [Pyrinomonadaceae bacterium]
MNRIPHPLARLRAKVLAIVLIILFICASFSTPTTRFNSASAAPAETNAEARATLAQGKTFLRQNRADQALALIENALSLFERTADKSGAGAAHDAIGDIYLRYGQYGVALEHYQSALEAFRSMREQYNLNLTFEKIGEARYLAGDTAGANSAFAQVNAQMENTTSATSASTNAAGATGNASDGTPESNPRRFASALAMLRGVSCFVPKNAANKNPADPPNEGHAPQYPGGSGRMDLRVFDGNGNPVKNVQARLVSRNPAGLPKNYSCESSKTTNEWGRALMDPLHIGRLTLTLKANGYQPLELPVTPEQLQQPLRITMQARSGAAQAGNATNTANVLSIAGTCFDLYRFFVLYARRERGAGRANFAANQLDAAKSNYQNLLDAADANSAIGKLGEARLSRVVARTSLADIAFRQGRFADALTLYTEAAEGARSDERLELMWAAERGIGKSRRALAAQESDEVKKSKLKEDAIIAYRAAIKTIELLFAGSPRADDSRAAFLATTKDVFDEASTMLAEMALALSSASSPLDGKAYMYAAEAFKITEQGRARSLLDLLGEAKAEISEGVAPELLKRKKDNQARQQEIAGMLMGVNLAGERPKATVEELQTELDRLSIEYDALENQIRVASPRYAALTRTQPLQLPQIQQQLLDDKTALLEYNLGDERSYLWVVTQNALRLYSLPARSALERLAMDLRAQLIPAQNRRSIVRLDTASDSAQRGLNLGGAAAPTPTNAASYANAANALYKAIIESAANVLNDKRLLIIADGALNYVPFEALVTAAGGTDYAALPYLVKTNEIAYAPSASVLSAIRQQTAAGATRGSGMLIIADPVFDSNDPRATGTGTQGTNAANLNAATRGLALGSAVADVTGCNQTRGLALGSGASSSGGNATTPNCSPKNMRLARLNGTRTEAEEIAQTARSSGGKADVWLDLDASETNVTKRDLKQYRVLHIATHGLLNSERPQFT